MSCLKKLIMRLSQHYPVSEPENDVLPERILQFGTGVVLRGLCGYFVDKTVPVICQNTNHGGGIESEFYL